MFEEYLPDLSLKASKVLLTLLLAREQEVTLTQAEFATRSGLSRRSISDALPELEQLGLITIIPQPGQVSKVRLNLGREYAGETVVIESEPLAIRASAPPLLAAPDVVADTPSQASRGIGERGDAGDGEEELPLIERCQVADANQNRYEQVAALMGVWDEVFPAKDYPYQRLTPDTAKRFLSKRSAEEACRIILDAKKHARAPIKSPRAYVEKALEGARVRGKEGHVLVEDEATAITDELRSLAELGRRQFHAESD